MKKLIVVLMMPLGILSAFGQEREKPSDAYSIGAHYTHEFMLDGYVRVREWEFTGDKMNLRDLGMNSYPAVQVYVARKLKKDRTITLLYDHFFMRGNATFDRDITYNGTIIDGRKGIDVSPTRYYRVSLHYRGTMVKTNVLQAGYMAGLVFDHVKFYLDGQVTPESTKNEVYEGFGRQAFPYPVVGVNAKTRLGDVSKLAMEVSGTYIPGFKSFYTEGGHVYLQYSLFQTDFHYAHDLSHFTLEVGGKLRYMHLFQESAEDTNILDTFTAGPYVGVTYGF